MMFEELALLLAGFVYGTVFGLAISSLPERLWAYWVRWRKERQPKRRQVRFTYHPCPNVERWRPLVAEYFKPEDVDRALSIIQRASNGDPDAVGDNGHSVGLFQLHDQGIGLGLGNGRYDPETNIAVAAAIVYGGLGWRPWEFYEREQPPKRWWRRRLSLLGRTMTSDG